MPNIIPIRDLKNTTKVSDMCHETDQPIFVTKNGYADAVIMSNEVYESQMKRIEAYYKGFLWASKNDEVMKELEKLSPEDTMENWMNAKTPEEELFFEMLGNLLIQIKQREVIAKGDLF